MKLMRRPPPHFAERMIERVLFNSRWLLAPVCLGLARGLPFCRPHSSRLN